MLKDYINEYNVKGYSIFQNHRYTTLSDLFYTFCIANGYENLTASATTQTFTDGVIVYQLSNQISPWKLFQSLNRNKYLAQCECINVSHGTYIEVKKYDIFLDSNELNLIKSKVAKAVVCAMTEAHYNYFNTATQFDKRSQLLLIDSLLVIANSFNDKDLFFVLREIRKLVNGYYSIDFKLENLLYDSHTELPIFWDVVYP